jgi:hypothetical protein
MKLHLLGRRRQRRPHTHIAGVSRQQCT